MRLRVLGRALLNGLGRPSLKPSPTLASIRGVLNKVNREAPGELDRALVGIQQRFAQQSGLAATLVIEPNLRGVSLCSPRACDAVRAAAERTADDYVAAMGVLEREAAGAPRDRVRQRHRQLDAQVLSELRTSWRMLRIVSSAQRFLTRSDAAQEASVFESQSIAVAVADFRRASGLEWADSSSPSRALWGEAHRVDERLRALAREWVEQPPETASEASALIVRTQATGEWAQRHLYLSGLALQYRDAPVDVRCASAASLSTALGLQPICTAQSPRMLAALDRRMLEAFSEYRAASTPEGAARLLQTIAFVANELRHESQNPPRTITG